MGDTTPATFDAAPEGIGPTKTFIAGAAILEGQVVGFAATGVSRGVIPTDTDASAGVVGVAMHDAASGAKVAVALVGSVIKVCEGKGAAIDAGDFVQTCDIAGCVKTMVVTAAGEGVGIAIDDIAANGTGYIIVAPFAFGKGA